jgi:hypothetical protein
LWPTLRANVSTCRPHVVATSSSVYIGIQAKAYTKGYMLKCYIKASSLLRARQALGGQHARARLAGRRGRLFARERGPRPEGGGGRCGEAGADVRGPSPHKCRIFPPGGVLIFAVVVRGVGVFPVDSGKCRGFFVGVGI